MRLIEAHHLRSWAGSKMAENRFPYFIKQLILAVIQPEKLQMPSGDVVWIPGFDGVVVNADENRFVPTGLSMWEVGTNANFKNKANKDYKKRSAEAKHDEEGKAGVKFERDKITFVFVTPLVWKDKEDWIDQRKIEGIWKDIVILDGAELQDWFEAAPAVNLQFAAELGVVPEQGIQTLDMAWEEWAYLTDPPAIEELVVADRREQENELIGRLFSPPNTFTVRGDSPREAYGFALAALRRITSEEELLSLHARTIVADNQEVAGRLRHQKNLIIVLKQTSGQVSGLLSTRSCHAIIPEGNDIYSERNVIELVRPTHRVFTEALTKMGLSEEEAARVARACGRSVTVLQRQLAHSNFERPAWSDDKNINLFLPALLAGRWNGQSKPDREILCLLAGEDDYDTVEEQLMRFLWVDESPILKIEAMWTLVAPLDAFHLIARSLTNTFLKRYADAFATVFSQIDPRVEIPPDEWLSVDFVEDQGYSGVLRSGLAETLLLIAEHGEKARLLSLRSPEKYAENLVSRLPDLNNDWRILASLRDQYARLIEATPDPLLDGLEQLLEANPDSVRSIFVDGGLFGSGSMHTGLLWGLETLAWNPEYLPRVALILGKLARLDPGGALLNRPINSLREIFLWWHPGTNANNQQRLEAIDLVLAHEPDVGWSLLANLLPQGLSSHSTGTAKPRWRDIGDIPETTKSRTGQIQFVSAIIDRVLEYVGSDPKRWQTILRSISGYSSSQQQRALDQLDSVTQGPLLPEVKTALWKVLHDFINKQRVFQGANWALAENLVIQLEVILQNLAPKDPVERNLWLFDEWLPDLPLVEEDTKERQEQIEAQRQKAIQEILEDQNIVGLVKLGTICKFPFLVAHSSILLLADIGSVYNFTEQAISKGDAGLLLASFISERARWVYGEAWSNLIHSKAKAETWTPNEIATLISRWPDVRETWEDAKDLGIEMDYWRLKPATSIEGSLEDQTFQIDHLIEARRATTAFHLARYSANEVPSDSLLRLFDATFQEILKAKTEEEIQMLGLKSTDMREFLARLRERTDLPREELARREYQVLPLLNSVDARDLILHEIMAEDPHFFVNVLCDAFLPAHRDKSKDAKPAPDVLGRAQAAFTLLQGMELIPGHQRKNHISEKTLIKWIESARAKAKEMDRAIIADQYIGQILAHAPEDLEDGGWPHKVIRSVIDRQSADEIDKGVMIGRFNMRGIFSKEIYEGGDEERSLSLQYGDWANISRENWPRTARVLEMIAQSWEEQGKREDNQAEWEKMEH